MNIPKKYIHQSGRYKGRINQDLLQTKKPRPAFKKHDPHPFACGLFFLQYRRSNAKEHWVDRNYLEIDKENSRKYNDSNKSKKSITYKQYAQTEKGKQSLKRRKIKYRNSEKGKQRELEYRSRTDVKERHCINNREYTKKNLFLVTTRSRYSKLIPNLHKHWEAHELLGADDTTVRKHIEDQFQEGMTWDNHGEWHIDHILPCKMKHPLTGDDIFDLTKPSHQKLLFNYRNLQPLWESDNCSKQDKIPWYVLLTILMNNYKTITI